MIGNNHPHLSQKPEILRNNTFFKSNNVRTRKKKLSPKKKEQQADKKRTDKASKKSNKASKPACPDIAPATENIHFCFETNSKGMRAVLAKLGRVKYLLISLLLTKNSPLPV